jgi:hypothetical protein
LSVIASGVPRLVAFGDGRVRGAVCAPNVALGALDASNVALGACLKGMRGGVVPHSQWSGWAWLTRIRGDLERILTFAAWLDLHRPELVP